MLFFICKISATANLVRNLLKTASFFKEFGEKFARATSIRFYLFELIHKESIRKI